MTTAALVKKVRRIDAAMEANLRRTGDLSAQRRAAIRELVELVGNVEDAADHLGIGRSAVYKALSR